MYCALNLSWQWEPDTFLKELKVMPYAPQAGHIN